MKTTRNNLHTYIKSASRRVLKEKKEWFLFGKIPIHIQDPLPQNVDIDLVMRRIQSRVPGFLFNEVDIIFVGSFDHFSENDSNAFYSDGAIYTTNNQSSEEDMVDDIVHELAHSVEQFATSEIYEDGLLEREFLGKRKRLFDILQQEGYNVNLDAFMNPEYSKYFDKFLYENIGYPSLTSLSMGLFASPYAITSLREYFANGFEEYFLRDRVYLKKISPVLFNKLSIISDLREV